MQQLAQNTGFPSIRLRPGTSSDGCAIAQEVPTVRATPARKHRMIERDLCALNEAEGRLVPAAARPSGVIWRVHPAPVNPDVTGAAIAPGSSVLLGARS
jgi:hypothetical protein